MLIKNLPQPIKELVFKRQIEQGNQPNEEINLFLGKMSGNFNFAETHECVAFWREISKQNYKPFFEKYGGVILCTSVEQGAKIIEYFKSLGVDTKHYRGFDVGIYYGLINNKFAAYSKTRVKENNIPIFTLDELGVEQTQNVDTSNENVDSLKDELDVQRPQEQPELPEINFEGIEMEVWDNEDENIVYYKGKVIAKVNGRYLLDDWTFWDNARPIQQKVKVTKEQIAEAFNTTVEFLEIEP